MNIGYPCKCGCEKVHARLAKYGQSLYVELRCSKCGASYSEVVAFDGCDFIDWEAFTKKYYPEDMIDTEMEEVEQ